jgi:hypothetical protein
MIRLILGLSAVLLFLSSALAVRAERLEAVWIGPDGNGGAGNWSTPENWSLGVLPHNGADGNGDGLPDTFDVKIDDAMPDMSSVLTDTLRTEIANLAIAADDQFEIAPPTVFVLDDPDGASEIMNNGLVRVGYSLSFLSDSLALTGNGTMELGLVPAGPGGLSPFAEGARIVNGPNHTIRTSGLRSGRIGGLGVALTNEGTILAADRGVVVTQLNHDSHHNLGTIRATGFGTITVASDAAGTFRNTGLLEAASFGRIHFYETRFVNDPAGVVRASDDGIVSFPQASVETTNTGLIEAVNHGLIRIERTNIINMGQGVVRAKDGGTIWLTGGTFRPDPAIQIADADSELRISIDAVFENAENVLHPGPGILRLGSSRIRGGEVTSGSGTLVLENSTFQDVKLSGVASGYSMGVRGTLIIDSGFTANPSFNSSTSSVSMERFKVPGFRTSTAQRTSIRRHKTSCILRRSIECNLTI